MFDAILQPRPWDPRRPLLLAAAGVAHAALLGAAVAASLVVVDVVRDPDLLLTFVGVAAPPSVPPPPPPRGTPRGAPAAPAANEPRPTPDAPVQPQRIEPLTRADLERAVEEAGDGDPGGHPDGDERGVAGGVPGSPFTGMFGQGGLGDSGTTAENEPLIITADIREPVLIERVEPEYPEIARRSHQQGKVILRAVIGPDGRVETIEVLRSAALFDEAAVAAVRRWRYRPATLDGEAVRVYLTVVITFQLM